MGYSQSKPII